MIDFDRLKLYKQYLNTIQPYLDKYFEDQKEYLSCQKGCSHCCRNGSYPYSNLEFEYLKIGLLKMDLNEQKGVIRRIQKLKADYQKVENKEKYMYECPFINEEGICTVYEYRGIICRVFGLLKTCDDGEIVIPFCQNLGLNYSKVYNKESRKIDNDLVKKFGYKNTPKAYDLSFKTLMREDMFENVKVDFGEIKSLVEWL